MMEELSQSHGDRIDLVDDECSTDSGCSSSGSTSSAELLYVERARGSLISGQERLSQLRTKSSHSWSPEDKIQYQDSLVSKTSSHSSSISDTPSSDSDSFNNMSTERGLRKALQRLRISRHIETSSTPTNDTKLNTKKGQKRILRSPVAYTYVKGLSGLPTQRIPRNAV